MEETPSLVVSLISVNNSFTFSTILTPVFSAGISFSPSFVSFAFGITIPSSISQMLLLFVSRQHSFPYLM
jgi:hypothetical protein